MPIRAAACSLEDLFGVAGVGQPACQKAVPVPRRVATAQAPVVKRKRPASAAVVTPPASKRQRVESRGGGTGVLPRGRPCKAPARQAHPGQALQNAGPGAGPASAATCVRAGSSASAGSQQAPACARGAFASKRNVLEPGVAGSSEGDYMEPGIAGPSQQDCSMATCGTASDEEPRAEAIGGPVTETREEHLHRHAHLYHTQCPRCKFYKFEAKWAAKYGSEMHHDPSRRVKHAQRWLHERPSHLGGDWGIGCTLCAHLLARISETRRRDNPKLARLRLATAWAKYMGSGQWRLWSRKISTGTQCQRFIAWLLVSFSHLTCQWVRWCWMRRTSSSCVAQSHSQRTGCGHGVLSAPQPASGPPQRPEIIECREYGGAVSLSFSHELLHFNFNRVSNFVYGHVKCAMERGKRGMRVRARHAPCRSAYPFAWT
jgi:hypothetical protein